MTAADPDELLSRIRAFVADVRDKDDPTLYWPTERGAHLAADVDELDKLISGGGELPRAWRPRSETWVVVGQGRWGSGDTLEKAKRQFTAEGGRLTHGYMILRFDPDTEFHGVDQWGRYSFTGNEPARTDVRPKSRPPAR